MMYGMTSYVRMYYYSQVKNDVLWTRAVSCGLGDIPEVYQNDSDLFSSISCITDYSKVFSKPFFMFSKVLYR